MGKPKRDSWTIQQMREDLNRYETALIEANLNMKTVNADVNCTKQFLRWLEGDFIPTGPRE